MKKKLIFVLIAVIVILGGAATIVTKQKSLAGLPKPISPPVAIQTVRADQGILEVTSRQLGEIQPYVQAEIAPRITGYIITINKREGDVVAKGEIVCTIDNRELTSRAEAGQGEVLATKQRLAGARSVYETQRSVTERDEKLFRAGAVSKEALERSQATLASAKATVDAYEESIRGQERNVEAARFQVGYARIAAPFSGIVTRRSAEPGDLAIPGKAILTIQQPSPVKVMVQIPQELVGRVKPGSKLILGNGPERSEVNISKIYPALGKNLLGSIEAVLPKSPFGLPTGSTVNVDIVTSKISGTLIPEAALVRTANSASVYLVNDGIIHICPVEVLGTGKGQAVIKGNIPAGARLAVAQENKLLTLSEGMKVISSDRGDKR
jgi:RND family efflux transporter MFP subunit